jgi:hypothetical protein
MLTIVGLLLLGAGVAIGWFAAKGSANTAGQGTPGLPVISFRAGDKDLLAPAPSWEEWKYPQSRVHNSSTGDRSKIGEIELGSMDRAALVTPDAFDKVWAFYKEKCQLCDYAGSTRRFAGGGNEQAVTVTIFDDIQAHRLEGPKSELVQARAFSVQSLRYSLIGFVYRPRRSDSTCILLVYRPHPEFIGLLKSRDRRLAHCGAAANASSPASPMRLPCTTSSSKEFR